MQAQDVILGVTISDKVVMRLGVLVDRKALKIKFSEQSFAESPDRSNVAQSVPEVIAKGINEFVPPELRSRFGWLSMSMIGLTTGASLVSKGIAREGWSLGEGITSCDFAERLKQAVPSFSALIDDDISKRRASLINDTTASAMGELQYGAGRKLDTPNLYGKAFAYVYVGTGANAGIVTDINHRPWLGQLHPELGHIRVPGIEWSSLGTSQSKKPKAGGSKIAIPGACRFHGDCLDGMLSHKAMVARWGEEPSENLWQTNATALETTAGAIAYLCSIVTMTTAPVKLVLGGYSGQPTLIARIRQRFDEIVNGYPSYEECENLDTFIVPAICGGTENMLGAMVYGAQRLGSPTFASLSRLAS